MKQTRRIPALLLAMVMLFSLTLTSCKKEEIVPADQVAVALFEMILKDDASSMVNLFGYADEAEARADMGFDDGSIYDELAESLIVQFESQGLKASNEDVQRLIDAFLSMFSAVKLTAVVKESDEKAGTAVVTCTINTFDASALTNAMGQVINDLMADEDLINSGDEEALASAMLNGVSDAISGLTPTDNTADFDVEFELVNMDINGKTQKVWVPADAAEFGNLISSTAMGG